MRVLVVAEKPSIALALAQALSAHFHSKVHTTQGQATAIHAFSGLFDGAQVEYAVSSVCGHVFGADFSAGAEDWEATDPSTLFSWPLVRVAERGAVAQQLKSLGRGVDVLLLALDSDREGDNIALEVMQLVVLEMNAPRGRFARAHPTAKVDGTPEGAFQSASSRVPGSVLRVVFSSLAAVDLLRAFLPTNFVAPNVLSARASDARQEVDLRLGVAWTRFLSRFLLPKYGAALRANKGVSLGPRQTLTLGLVVARDEIAAFVPEKFWRLDVSLRINSSQAGSGSGARTVKLLWDRGERLFSQEVAEMFRRMMLGTPSSLPSTARVLSVTRSTLARPPPLALNTVKLLKVGSRSLGLSPAETLRAAEALYTAGAISYPRTETSEYAAAFDIAAAVRVQLASEEWGPQAKALLEQLESADDARSKRGAAGGGASGRGHDARDHPPITPLHAVDPTQLRGAQGRVYSYVVAHFLSSVSPESKEERTEVRLRVNTAQEGGEWFSASTTRLTQRGWKEFMPWLLPKDEGENNGLLQLKEGDSVPLSSMEVTAHSTEPPGFLTESDLISLMEQHGIGTDASIAGHIQSIASRGVAELGPGRTRRRWAAC